MVTVRATQTDLEQLKINGYMILKNPLGEEMFAAVTEAAFKIEKSAGTKPGTDPVFDGVRTLRTSGLLARARIFEELVLHPEVLSIVEETLGDDCLLGSMNLFTIMPGETIQPLHSDHSLQPRRYAGLDTSGLHMGIVVMLALTDFTEANGATRVVPGSHKWEPLPLDLHEDLGSHIKYAAHNAPIVAAEMRRGDMLIFDARVWHGGGANRTQDQNRSGLIYAFWPGWLRPDQNNLLLLSKERIRGLPRRLQELIGLSRFDGHWGHVGGLDPREWLSMP